MTLNTPRIKTNGHEDEVDEQALLRWIDAALGRPFEWGARGPAAYDCYGLVLGARRAAGLYMPERYPSVRDYAVIAGLIEAERARSGWIELDGPRPGCVVAFRWRPPWVSHLGVVLPDLTRFCHVLKDCPVCVERLDHPTIARRIAGYYEHAR
jgi:cell wall-associated NlpC family hydrolase